MIKASIVESLDLPSLKNSFKGCIYFGVPKSRSQLVKEKKGEKTPSREEFTNADILFVLEHGSPAKNIPPRPLLRSVLKLHANELNDALYESLPIIFNGNQDEIDVYFEKLALRIQAWAQMYFVREGQLAWEPSLRVIRAHARGEEAKTLIDTGSLRQSIIAFYSKNGSDNG